MGLFLKFNTFLICWNNILRKQVSLALFLKLLLHISMKKISKPTSLEFLATIADFSDTFQETSSNCPIFLATFKFCHTFHEIACNFVEFLSFLTSSTIKEFHCLSGFKLFQEILEGGKACQQACAQ